MLSFTPCRRWCTKPVMLEAWPTDDPRSRLVVIRA